MFSIIFLQLWKKGNCFEEAEIPPAAFESSNFTAIPLLAVLQFN